MFVAAVNVIMVVPEPVEGDQVNQGPPSQEALQETFEETVTVLVPDSGLKLTVFLSTFAYSPYACVNACTAETL